MEESNWLCILLLRKQCHKVNSQSLDLICKLGKTIDFLLCFSPIQWCSIRALSTDQLHTCSSSTYQSNFFHSSFAFASQLLGTPSLPSSWDPSYVGGAVLENLTRAFSSSSCSSGIDTVKGFGWIFTPAGIVANSRAMLLRLYQCWTG